jgi:hypothetical protein
MAKNMAKTITTMMTPMMIRHGTPGFIWGGKSFFFLTALYFAIRCRVWVPESGAAAGCYADEREPEQENFQSTIRNGVARFVVRHRRYGL